jgi:hypothetical protein
MACGKLFRFSFIFFSVKEGDRCTWGDGPRGHMLQGKVEVREE